MTADVQRKLAEAVMADPGLRLDVQCGRLDHAEVILALLPTVQALIADAEKRAAAQAQLCPKCNGQGTVAKPPWIPGDVNSWNSGTVAPYRCNLCEGRKVISAAELDPS